MAKELYWECPKCGNGYHIYDGENLIKTVSVSIVVQLWSKHLILSMKLSLETES